MTLFIILISVVNIGLGYALAVYLGKQNASYPTIVRPIASAPAQAATSLPPNPIVADKVAEVAQQPVEEQVAEKPDASNTEPTPAASETPSTASTEPVPAEPETAPEPSVESVAVEESVASEPIEVPTPDATEQPALEASVPVEENMFEANKQPTIEEPVVDAATSDAEDSESVEEESEAPVEDELALISKQMLAAAEKAEQADSEEPDAEAQPVPEQNQDEQAVDPAEGIEAFRSRLAGLQGSILQDAPSENNETESEPSTAAEPLAETTPEPEVNVAEGIDAFRTQLAGLEDSILPESEEIETSVTEANQETPLDSEIEQETVAGIEAFRAQLTGLQEKIETDASSTVKAEESVEANS